MNKIINIIISVFIFAFFTSVSFSVDMPKVPGIGKKSGGGDIDVDALADQQSALVKNMTAALANIMTSQIKFAEALGKKNLADGLQKEIDNMKAGEATPKKDVKSAVKVTTDTQVAINKEMENATLDAEGKIKFAEGLPPYGTGSINMIGAGMESIKLFKSLKGTKDLTIIRKLGNLIYLGKTAPSLISTFSSATSSISAFNSKNGIEEPKAFTDATSAAQDVEL
tara:strand:+ start:1098 stop:1772 length:675 start_codon:yes stop_codon:yes gene_type:complete